jgi:phospholipid transport system substrate-binding protein
VLKVLTVLALALLAPMIAAAPAYAAADAEQYAQRVIDEGLAILRDTTRADRRARFHTFILGHLDSDKGAIFALGQYRRGANAQVLERYLAAFREYCTILYESRMDDYRDTKVTVTGSNQNRPNDVTVLARATGPGLRDPVGVAFRLLGGNGNFKLVDIQVVGIWLSIELRDEFAAILGRNGGNIDALTSTLIERTRTMQAAP